MNVLCGDWSLSEVLCSAQFPWLGNLFFISFATRVFTYYICKWFSLVLTVLLQIGLSYIIVPQYKNFVLWWYKTERLLMSSIWTLSSFHLHQQANQLDLSILFGSAFNFLMSWEASCHISLSSNRCMWLLTVSWIIGCLWPLTVRYSPTGGWKSLYLRVEWWSYFFSWWLSMVFMRIWGFQFSLL